MGLNPLHKRLTHGATGSMADMPKDLLDQIKELEELFTVGQSKLKEIVDHFIKELQKGKPIPLSFPRQLPRWGWDGPYFRTPRGR